MDDDFSVDTSQRGEEYYEERDQRKFVDFLVERQALRQFKYCHCSNSYQFLELALPECGLDDLTPVNRYPSITTLNLAGNKISNLKPLLNLLHLASLDLSRNLLRTAEFGYLPFKLRSLNLSRNQLHTVPNLMKFESLEQLDLSYNKIEDVNFLSKCRNLAELDLSHNYLGSTRGLKDLGLRWLDLSNNELNEIDPDFESLVELTVLLMNRNQVERLDHLHTLQKLRVLDLSCNRVQCFKEVEYLQDLLFLSEIDLSHCPVQERKYYQLQMLYRLPLLRKLDGDIVSPEKKIKAETFYGLDLDDRAQIWKYFLQHEDFIDTRVIVHDELEEESRMESEKQQRQERM